jgi:hypothetical protein
LVTGEHGDLASDSHLCSLQPPLLPMLPMLHLTPPPLVRPLSSLLSPRRLLLR